MHYNRFKKYFIASVYAVGLALSVGCDRLPYGFEHRKRIETAWLGSETSAWVKRGANDNELTSMGFTNKSGLRLSCYLTNINVNETSYKTILKLDADFFQNRGSLVSARDGSVIWVGNDGKCEITYQAKP
jgi:hypothetical protein